jgi:hypothetical protein
VEAIRPDPSKRPTASELLACILDGAFIPPCDFLHPDVTTFLSKCWNRLPEHRFQSVALAMEEWGKLLSHLKAGPEGVVLEIESTLSERSDSMQAGTATRPLLTTS